MPLYCTCSVSQRAIRRGLLPFGDRFVAEIFVQNLKWWVSQRGADVSYILIPLLLLYLKNLLSYTAWHNYFQAYIADQILPSHICIMCVYTIPLYCTWSVSQRCKKTRATSLRRRFVAEIFVQNLKWRVSQRRADVSYILIPLLLMYLKNLLSYTAWHNYFPAFCRSNLSQPHIYNVYNAFVLYLLSITARNKTRATSLRRPFCSRNIRPKFKTETPIILNFGRIFQLQNGRRREVALVLLRAVILSKYNTKALYTHAL